MITAEPLVGCVSETTVRLSPSGSSSLLKTSMVPALSSAVLALSFTAAGALLGGGGGGGKATSIETHSSWENPLSRPLVSTAVTT